VEAVAEPGQTMAAAGQIVVAESEEPAVDAAKNNTNYFYLTKKYLSEIRRWRLRKWLLLSSKSARRLHLSKTSGLQRLRSQRLRSRRLLLKKQ
jgi:hypothetical protein